MFNKKWPRGERYTVVAVYAVIGSMFWKLGFCESVIESPPPSGFNETLSLVQARFCIYESVRVQYMQNIARYSTVYDPVRLQAFVMARDRSRRDLCAQALLPDAIEATIVAELKSVRIRLNTQALIAISEAVDPSFRR